MWKNININNQNIKKETSRAILIAMPHSSDYDGWFFWHPLRLVHDGRHDYAVSIGYTDNFTFKLIKYGKGKWNKHEIIDEITISVKEFEEAFNIMDENIKAPEFKSDFETHKPKELKAVKVEALEELKDE